MKTFVEYRVRPVTRYMVTRHERQESDDGRTGSGGHSRQIGAEYANGDTAYQVAYALCKQEHELLGYPVADERITYPAHPDEHVVALKPVVGASDGFPYG